MAAPPVDRRPRLRGEDLVLTLLCTAAGPLLWWFGTTALAGAPSGGGIQLVERSVALLCAGAGAVIAAGWIVAVLGTALALCGHRWQSVRLTRLGQSLSPAFLRRVTASVLGVNILLAPGAWAADGAEHPGVRALPDVAPVAVPADVPTAASPAASATPHTVFPHPGWLTSAHPTSGADPAPPTPTWKPGAPTPATPGSTRAARPTTTEATTVTVRQGECLWDLAAHELGPTATDLEVDRRWRQWYQHNRSIIGAEADLIRPGTVLTAPPFD